MSVGLEELLRYLAGELDAAREAEVEEVLFEDATTARRLDALVQLRGDLRSLVSSGRLQSTLTVDALEQLERAGLEVRSYRVEQGVTVPCTIAREDLVAIRLVGDFGRHGPVDVVMDGTFEGAPPASERYDDVVVDRRAGEIVLVYPGERIRALPRSHFRYTVTSDGRSLGEYGLDHTPPA